MPADWMARLLFKQTSKARTLRPIAANAVTILGNDDRWRDVLAYDAFRETIVTTKAPPWHDDDAPATGGQGGDWRDEDTTRSAVWLSREYQIDLRTLLVHEAVGVVARRREIHPVSDWLAGLTWDGTARIETWASDCLGAKDTPYVRAVGRIFLLSAVARVMRPGCKVDTVPILESPQGRGKSTALRELAGEPFFLETGSELGSKDSFQQLRGKWIVELAELDALSRSDVSRTKAFISARVDTYRPSFGRRATDHPRQCIFVGTTNAIAYLKDDTGARRFLPIRCEHIDIGRLCAVREQLWAEARVRVERGEAWHIEDPALAALFAAEQESRFQIDPWEPTVAAWIWSDGHPRRRHEGVTTADVLEGCLAKEKSTWTRADEMRVGAVLRRLDWEPPENPVTREGARVRPYRPKDEQVARGDGTAANRVGSSPDGTTTQPAHPSNHAHTHAHSNAYGDQPNGWSCSAVVQSDDRYDIDERQAIVGGP